MGSYDQYSQKTLHNKLPNPITLLHHFRDLVSGLAHIESFQFVHLDLKPGTFLIQFHSLFENTNRFLANIFVSSPPHGQNIPSLLIGDFGTMVEAGTLLDDDQEGDGKYIAPEVFQENYKASTKFDIFSLALCIIEIATAEPV